MTTATRTRVSLSGAEAGRPAGAADDAAGIVYRAIVYGGSGYADGNLGVLLGLSRLGVPLQFIPEGPRRDERGLMSPGVRRTLEDMQRRKLEPATSVYFQSAPAMHLDRAPRGRVNVARTYFETDRLPDGWTGVLDEFDEVWAPSRFCGGAFAAAGVGSEKIRVVHEGVDASRFRPGLVPLPLSRARGFSFLSVFDWQHRKAPELLVRAFVEEFRPDEDVSLLMKIYTIGDPYADPESQVAHYLESELGVKLEDTPQIVLLNGFIPNDDMPRLYASADAFVLASRGEGFGRPYLEALSSELPVIATRWSGQLDFLSDENSFLVDIEGVVPVQNDVDMEIFAGHRWAEPSVAHLRAQMRRVFSDRAGARETARRGREDVLRDWDWPVRAAHWAREFRRLAE